MKKSKINVFNNLKTFDNKMFFKDFLDIEQNKNNLIFLRKKLKQNKDEIIKKEIEYSNFILQELKKFPYKKDISINLTLDNILETKEKFCLLYIIIANIFLDFLEIKHKVINISNHTAIELNIGNKKYYFDSLSFYEIQEFYFGKKIEFNNLKGVYRKIVFKNIKNFKKIFGYSGKSEKILKSMILNDLGNKEINIKKSYQNYKKALKLDKNSPTIYANLGSYYLEIGKYKKSLNFYNKSLLLNPTNQAVIENKKLLFQIIKEKSPKNLQR